MAIAFTTDAFDTAVVRRCGWPLLNAPLEQNARLSLANEEIAGTLFPRVLKAHAAYYLTVEDTVLEAGTEQYRAPSRAYGGYKAIKLVLASGEERELVYSDRGDRSRFGVGRDQPTTYYVDGDYIGLLPVPSDASSTLRVVYVRRPNDLVTLANAGVIATITRDSPGDGETAIELEDDSVLAIWADSDVDTLDIINPGNAYAVIASAQAYELQGEDEDELVIDGLVTERARVGDYVSLAETTPIVQLPSYLHVAAVRYIAGACLDAHGDREAAQIEFGHAEDMIANAFAVGIPRVESSARPITTRNSPFRIMGRR